MVRDLRPFRRPARLPVRTAARFVKIRHDPLMVAAACGARFALKRRRWSPSVRDEERAANLHSRHDPSCSNELTDVRRMLRRVAHEARNDPGAGLPAVAVSRRQRVAAFSPVMRSLSVSRLVPLFGAITLIRSQ